MAKYKDETGNRYGKLVVIEYAGTKNNKNKTAPAYWRCLCDCGKTTIVRGVDLRNGTTISCGCYRIEQSVIRGRENGWKHLREANIGHNRYDLSGEYGIGYDKNGNEFWFDKSDYELIKNAYWSMTMQGYFIHKEPNKSPIKIYNVIMGEIPDGYVVDHIDGNKFDNRKSNLRIATQHQNVMNTHRKPTVSGCIGVNKRGNKWRSRIRFNNDLICLGDYSNLEDAIRARLEAEAKYFGEFAPQRNMFAKYDISSD